MKTHRFWRTSFYSGMQACIGLHRLAQTCIQACTSSKPPNFPTPLIATNTERRHVPLKMKCAQRILFAPSIMGAVSPLFFDRSPMKSLAQFSILSLAGLDHLRKMRQASLMQSSSGHEAVGDGTECELRLRSSKIYLKSEMYENVLHCAPLAVCGQM